MGFCGETDLWLGYDSLATWCSVKLSHVAVELVFEPLAGSCDLRKVRRLFICCLLLAKGGPTFFSPLYHHSLKL